jgi:hypothetical protein
MQQDHIKKMHYDKLKKYYSKQKNEQEQEHHIHKPIPVRPMVIQTYSMESIWPEYVKDRSEAPEKLKAPVPYYIKTDHHHHEMHSKGSPPPGAPKAAYTMRDDLSPIRKAIDEYIEKHIKEGDIHAVHNLGRMLLDRVSHIL